MNIYFSLEFYFFAENVWEDPTKLTLSRAVSLSEKYLCVAHNIARKREEYEEPWREYCSVKQEALN